MQILTPIIAFLHILFSLMWFGGGVLFGVLLTPVLRSISQPAQSELMLKLYPNVVRYFRIVALLTLIFGVGLATAVTNGSPLSLLNLSSAFGLRISVAAILALIVYAMFEALFFPSTAKILQILEKLQSNPTLAPPPELSLHQNRMRTVGSLIGFLLFIVLILMVAAAWGPY